MPLTNVQSKLSRKTREKINSYWDNLVHPIHQGAPIIRPEISAGYGTHWFSLQSLGERELLRLEKVFIPLLMKAQRVLDIGCSAGEMLRWMHSINPNIHYAGLDFNGEAIKTARMVLKGISADLTECIAQEFTRYHEFDLLYTWNPSTNRAKFYGGIWPLLKSGTAWYEAANYNPILEGLLSTKQDFLCKGDYFVKP
jgi:2-polyprenyl-3-methyl-5-hydroxy-6-metoxy-1,4-benzoquinol methylase